jgi:hypothetical protein
MKGKVMKQTILYFFAVSLFILSSAFDIYAQASFQTGSIAVTVNSYGRIRLYVPDTLAVDPDMQRISILVGMDDQHVFDYQNDADNEEPTINVPDPQLSDFEIYGAFNNAWSALPPDILERVNIYGWDGGSFLLMKFTVINREASAFDAIFGMDLIPQVDQAYGFDTVTYVQDKGVIRFHRGEHEVGIKLLSHELTSLTSFEWYEGYTVDTDYWGWLNHGSIDPEYISNTADGPVTISAQDPINLTPQDSMVVYYALSFGNDQTEMLDNMDLAVAKYQNITAVARENNLVPESFVLSQNFPNPFNPATKISFSVPSRQNVILKVYNSLGQEVSELVNAEMSPGNYTVDFNASSLSSGVYFYKISTEDFSLTKKMLLLK